MGVGGTWHNMPCHHMVQENSRSVDCMLCRVIKNGVKMGAYRVGETKD